MSKQHQNTKVFMNSPKYDLGSVQLSSNCLDIQGLIPVSAQTTVILQCCTEYPLVQHPVVMHRYPRFQNSSSMVQYCCPGLMVIPWFSKDIMQCSSVIPGLSSVVFLFSKVEHSYSLGWFEW